MAVAVKGCNDPECQEYVPGTSSYLSACAEGWDAHFNGMKITQQTLQAAASRLVEALA